MIRYRPVLQPLQPVFFPKIHDMELWRTVPYLVKVDWRQRGNSQQKLKQCYSWIIWEVQALLLKLPT